MTSAVPKGYELLTKRIAQTHSDLPIPTRPVPANVKNLTGRTRGALTVVGLSADGKKNSDGSGQLWVVRCVCGMYLTRRSRSIQNPDNNNDCCDRCRHVRYLKKAALFRATGIDVDQVAP